MNGGDNVNQTNFDKIPEINYSDVPGVDDNTIKNNQNNNEESNLMKELYTDNLYKNDSVSNSIKQLTTIEEASKEDMNSKTSIQANNNIVNNFNNNINNIADQNNKVEINRNEYSIKESIIPPNREENQDLNSFFGPNYDLENIVKNLGQEFSILEEEYLEVIQIGVVDDKTFKNITSSELEHLKKAKEVVESMEYEGKIISIISGIEYLLMKSQNVNDNNRQNIQKSLEQKSDKIYAWREVLPGNDSFFRSVMFIFLEGIILSRNKNMFRLFIYMLDDNLKNDYFKKILSFYQIEPSRVKLYLILIYCILFSGDNAAMEKAHSFLIKVYNSETFFDPLLILNLKFSIYKYLKTNEKRIYTQEYNKKMGELLPSGYKEGERFKEFYENNLLQLGKKVENISILVIPFILRRDLFIYSFNDNDINHFWIHTEGRENQKFMPMNLISINDSYYIIYQKNYFMQFKNILNKFSNVNNNLSNNKNNANANNYVGNILDNIDDIDENAFKDSKIPINKMSNFFKQDNINNENYSKQNNKQNINMQMNHNFNEKINNNMNHNINNNLNNNLNNNMNNNMNSNVNINYINNNNEAKNNNNYNISNTNNNMNLNNHINNNYVNGGINSKDNFNKNPVGFQNNNNNYNLKNQNSNFDNKNNYSKKVNNNYVNDYNNINNNKYIKNNNEIHNYNYNINNNNKNTNFVNFNNYQNKNVNKNYENNNINNNYNTMNNNMANNKINTNINNNNINNNNINNNYNKYNPNQGNLNNNIIRHNSQETNNYQNNLNLNKAFPKENIIKNQNFPIANTFNKNNFNKTANTNWQCSECRNGFYCENCILKILIENMKKAYIKFISENKANIMNDKSKKLFSEFLSNLIIYFPNKEKKPFPETYYLLTDLNKNNFNSQLNIIKSSICLGCFKYIKDETHYTQNKRGIGIKNTFLYKFPCGCVFCSEKCLNEFLEQIPIMRMSTYICACGEEYNCIKLKYLLYFSISHNLNLFKNEILRIMFEYMKNKCCICNIEVPFIQGKKNDFNIFEIGDQEIEQIFKINKFNHLVCNKCAKNKDISKKNLFYCKMCSSEHFILNKKTIQNGQIRANCLIF